ncbi:MAG: hypothetical protein ACOH10_13880 [Rhodoglobus sp.]
MESSLVGTLYYADGSRVAVTISDRELAHLKYVMVTKLRRGEPFTFSWDIPETDGGGRSSVWVSREIPLQFVFNDTAPQDMNRAWLDELSQLASTVSGLTLTPEPA